MVYHFTRMFSSYVGTLHFQNTLSGSHLVWSFLLYMSSCCSGVSSNSRWLPSQAYHCGVFSLSATLSTQIWTARISPSLCTPSQDSSCFNVAANSVYYSLVSMETCQITWHNWYNSLFGAHQHEWLPCTITKLLQHWQESHDAAVFVRMLVIRL